MGTIAERLEEARLAAGYKTAKEFAEKHGIPQPTYALHESGKRGLSRQFSDKDPRPTLVVYAEILGVRPSWLQFGQGPMRELQVDTHSRERSEKAVAGKNQLGATSRGEKRTGAQQQPTYSVPVVGSVRAGAWAESYLLPEWERTEMQLPEDPRFPGVPRYALRNDGESMNKVCRNGGTWVYVQLMDLIGVGPRPGDYVIVERKRDDEMIEATCKRLEVRAGRPWLVPQSSDPSFEAFPVDPEPGSGVIEVRVVGLVTGAFNSL